MTASVQNAPKGSVRLKVLSTPWMEEPETASRTVHYEFKDGNTVLVVKVADTGDADSDDMLKKLQTAGIISDASEWEYVYDESFSSAHLDDCPAGMFFDDIVDEMAKNTKMTFRRGFKST